MSENSKIRILNIVHNLNDGGLKEPVVKLANQLNHVGQNAEILNLNSGVDENENSDYFSSTSDSDTSIKQNSFHISDAEELKDIPEIPEIESLHSVESMKSVKSVKSVHSCSDGVCSQICDCSDSNNSDSDNSICTCCSDE